MTKEEIIIETNLQFQKLKDFCIQANDSIFFANPSSNKWSIADNLKHLLISTNMSAMAFWLPKFLIRFISGTANRPSKSYQQLVDKYNLKLQQGGVASGRFVPKPTKDLTKKNSLLKQWDKVAAHYISSLSKKRTEKDLDNLLIRHPLLGKITLRELCYFTIYHTQHHLQTISTITSINNDTIL
jgi:hypothetical protein